MRTVSDIRVVDTTVGKTLDYAMENSATGILA